MEIRLASSEEMISVWYKKHTSEFFQHQIDAGSADFWALVENEHIIGELYVFYELHDETFAVKDHTAYLCAFRVHKDYRGKGYGTKLMNHVLNELRIKKLKYVIIGVEDHEIENIKLYKRLGFTEAYVRANYDPCDRTEENLAVMCETYQLLRKKL